MFRTQIATLLFSLALAAQSPVMIPAIDGAWWTVEIPGRTRLFHRWEGQRLMDRDWTPKGIAMTAEPGFGPGPGRFRRPRRPLLVGRLPVAAPEIILHEGQYFIASLLPNLQGIRAARLKWVEKE